MIRFISTVFLVATRTQHATVRSMGSKFEAIVYVKQAELWIDMAGVGSGPREEKTGPWGCWK